MVTPPLVATMGRCPMRPTWVKNTGSELRQLSSISVGRCMTAAEYALDRAMSAVIGRAPSIRSIRTMKPP
jgi:hypothetical protein